MVTVPMRCFLLSLYIILPNVINRPANALRPWTYTTRRYAKRAIYVLLYLGPKLDVKRSQITVLTITLKANCLELGACLPPVEVIECWCCSVATHIYWWHAPSENTRNASSRTRFKALRVRGTKIKTGLRAWDIPDSSPYI